jgi:hypothetical protein
MPTPDPDGLNDSKSQGYEITDVNTGGILVFMVSLFVFVGVFFVFCFGMGKVINTVIIQHDGPLNIWNRTTEKAPNGLQNLTSNAAMEQQELHRMTQQFPTPRLEMDDGDQDITDLHAREDLLLDHYSWVDRQQGTVRIPIARAMELLAQHGLPVVPGAQKEESLMTGDTQPVVTPPLTDGFARTGYEQQYLTTMQQQRARGESTGEQAALGAQR